MYPFIVVLPWQILSLKTACRPHSYSACFSHQHCTNEWNREVPLLPRMAYTQVRGWGLTRSGMPAERLGMAGCSGKGERLACMIGIPPMHASEEVDGMHCWTMPIWHEYDAGSQCQQECCMTFYLSLQCKPPWRRRVSTIGRLRGTVSSFSVEGNRCPRLMLFQLHDPHCGGVRGHNTSRWPSCYAWLWAR
jgi:hypothetical protein